MENELTPVETTATELVPMSPIDQRHARIGQSFIERVQAILTNGQGKVKKYAVSEEYHNTELLELALSDKATLTLQIQTRP